MVSKYQLLRGRKGLTNVILPVFIIFILIFSAPAGAVKVTLAGITDLNEGNSLTFDLTVKMEYTNERIPIGNVTVILQNISNPSDTKEYAFALDGANLTAGISATRTVNDLNYSSGNLTGYENGTAYEFGYSYGYGYGMGTHSYKYSINITDADNLVEGNYSITVKLETGNGTKSSFDSQPANFTIYASTAADATPPTITITNPADASSISSLNDTISGSITDNAGISNVTLYVDGALQYSWTTAGAFSKKVNYTVGQWNTVNITATDTSDNVKSKEFSVNVLSLIASVTDVNATANQTTEVDTKNQTNAIIEFVSTKNATVNITVQGSSNASAIGTSDFTSTYGVASDQRSLNKFIQINVSGTGMNATSNISWVMLKVYYGDADLDRNGDGDATDAGDIKESSLNMYWYCDNCTSTKWYKLANGSSLVSKGGPEVYDTGTDADANYMWANLSHFSSYGLGGTIIEAASTPSTGGGGGGGGGGSYKPSIATEYGVANITIPFSFKGEKKIIIPETEDMPVTEFTIDIKKYIRGIKISINTFDLKPETVPEAEDVVYRYLEINKEKVENYDINQIAIKFKVEKSWMSNEDIDPRSVALYRYSDGVWNKTETASVNENDTYMYFYSTSDGLSYFAISGEVLAGTEPTVTPPPQSTTTTVPSGGGFGTTTPTTVPTTTTTLSVEDTGSKAGRMILILVIIAIIASVAYYWFVMKDGQK